MMFSVAVITLLAATQAMTFDDAVNHIKGTFPVNVGIGSLCQANTCCNISTGESCPLSSMTRDNSLLVLPGGETRCIYSTSTPFAFQVIPGDSDKVLFYFQGGGACWDKYSTSMGMCTSDSTPQSAVGIFDRNNVKNAYRSHTIVHVLYCSGDVFGGDVTRDYNDKRGQPVVQKGLANVQSALEWVKSQQSNGGLATKLSELTVMGCSAGSVGAQIWAKEVLSALTWNTAAVIPDSYAGVFPPGSQSPMMKAFGYCKAYFLTDALRALCEGELLTLQDVNADSMNSKTSTLFSFIQSKVDIVQQSFYVAIALTMNITAEITPSQFYNDVNEIFGGYNQARPNFVTYLVDGDQHCFTNHELYYTADNKGPSDNGATNTGLMMSVWVDQNPLEDGESASTSCEGSLQKAVGLDDNTYCSNAVSPKTFVEKY